jgi:hypothetical protein
LVRLIKNKSSLARCNDRSEMRQTKIRINDDEESQPQE